MGQLRVIYQLLKVEYAQSRHICWLEDGHVVNDVTYLLRLLVQAAQGLRRQDETGWHVLVEYAVSRAMSANLMMAMDQYLRACGDFPPLPIISFNEDAPKSNWRGGSVPLLDESDVLKVTGMTERPEPERQLVLKSECQWSHALPRLRDKNPHRGQMNQTKATHWLL